MNHLGRAGARPVRRAMLLLVSGLAAVGVLGLLAIPANAAERRIPPANAVSLYGGPSVTTTFTSLFYQPWSTEFDDTVLFGAAYSRRLGNIWDHLDAEVEAIVARRIGDGGDVWEFNGAIKFRWDDFPWNEYVYTTFAIAIGPSYATKVTQEEKDKGGGKGSHFLNYFAPEITFADPDEPDMQAVIKVHHRSGAFGLINDVKGGSSFLSFGLQFRF